MHGINRLHRCINVFSLIVINIGYEQFHVQCSGIVRTLIYEWYSVLSLTCQDTGSRADAHLGMWAYLQQACVWL